VNTQNFNEILLNWAIPTGFKDLIKRHIQSLEEKMKGIPLLCSSNIIYRNIHKGQRCFIVCSGPSVKNQNLLPLKSEITFFVSTGFLHPDYSVIQPEYHCTPDILLTPQLSLEKYVEWFNLMDKNIGDSQLFLSAADAVTIKQNNLFSDRRVSYLNMGLEWNPAQKPIYDITKKMPGIQSVPIMAIMIAMYMGCKEIYLLGVDLDELWSGKYDHFYDNEIMRNDVDVNEDGRSTTPLIEMFNINFILWNQFNILKGIAEANNIEIFNATLGGALDIYKRVKFEDLFHE
jgi:hypothetical protein